MQTAKKNKGIPGFPEAEPQRVWDQDHEVDAQDGDDERQHLREKSLKKIDSTVIILVRREKNDRNSTSAKKKSSDSWV